MIVLVGILLNGFPHYDLATIRLPGVLQRIGLVFWVAASASGRGAGHPTAPRRQWPLYRKGWKIRA